MPKSPAHPDSPASARKTSPVADSSRSGVKVAATAASAAKTKASAAKATATKSSKAVTAKKAAGPTKIKAPARQRAAAVVASSAAAPAPEAQTVMVDSSLSNLSPLQREERIRALAYSYYESRDGAEGSAMDDWLRAEATVAHEIAGALERLAGD